MPPPTIPSMSEGEGPTAGGTTVVLSGTNLDTVTDVDFFDAGLTACSFVIDGPTQITIASMPPHARAIGVILVTNPDGNGTSTDAFTYEDSGTAPRVLSVTPAEGAIAGGTSVTILGFQFTGVTDVDFGGVAAASFAFIDDSQIIAVAPSTGFAHGVYVTVTAGGEDSPVGLPTVFAYSEAVPPVTPTSTCIGLSLGTGFLADGATGDLDGICYTVQAIDGWFDSPPLRSGTLEASDRGETVTVARELGRAVNVQLLAHTVDKQTPLGNVLCFTAIEAIKTAFRAVFVPVVMDVIDPSGQERTMIARRVGPIKAEIIGVGTAVRFTIPMFGEDPTLVIV